MTREKYIKYGVILVIVILMFIFAMSIFGGKGNAKLYEELAASKERDKAYAREIQYHRERAEQAIAEKENAYELLKQKEDKVIVKYEKIPVYIRTLSKDSLRSAIWKYE